MTSDLTSERPIEKWPTYTGPEGCQSRVESPIIDGGKKWYPVFRYDHFPHGQIVEYFETFGAAQTYSDKINHASSDI